MIDDLYHPYKVVSLGDPYEFTPHGIVPQLIHVTYPQIDRQRNNEIHQFWLDRFIIRRNPKKQQVLKPSNIKLKLLFAPGQKCITMSSIISSLSHQWGRYVHWNVIEINERFVYVKEWFPIIIWNDSQCQKMVWPRLFFIRSPEIYPVSYILLAHLSQAKPHWSWENWDHPQYRNNWLAASPRTNHQPTIIYQYAQSFHD